jgi:hypothetical protein
MCVYNGQCFDENAEHSISGSDLICAGGNWVDLSSTTCSQDACNNNDGCESCPGCAYKDYSCQGGSCTASYIDPDQQEQLCTQCGQIWGGSSCCGDDNKEYWSQPCPDSSASPRCCNSPNDRIDKSGNCVSSCGLEITANVTEIKDDFIPIAISLLPDTVEIEPGDTIDFKVFVRTEWNQSLHNVTISFCKEFDFEIDPPFIDEVEPNKIVSFNVRMYAPENSTIGEREFEVYLDANELQSNIVESNVLRIGTVDYTLYYAMVGLTVAIILIVAARKFLIHKEKSPKKSKPDKPIEEIKEPQESDDSLVKYIRNARKQGIPDEKIRQALGNSGWNQEEIDKAFQES